MSGGVRGILGRKVEISNTVVTREHRADSQSEAYLSHVDWKTGVGGFNFFLVEGAVRCRETVF
jgi:hypothetical protein